MSNTAERHHGLHVLRLSGSDYEMGHQHGTALRDAIARGPIPYFARYVERMLHSVVGSLARPLASIGGRALYETVGRRIAARFPSNVRQGLDGLADGAKIPRAELMRAVTMPETYLWVASRFIALQRAPIAPRHDVPTWPVAMPTMGCTSAVAWGDATTHGRMLHGRNFDYQGVGVWDREQAVVFHRPTDGQRYVSIAAAGILMGGITAMNESGLTLVVHQHLHSSDFDLGGLPIGVIGDRVMRHAKSLDDARKILDDHVPNGAWTYVITSARERSMLCYEVTAKRRAIVPLEPGQDTFGYSNVYLSEALSRLELHGYPTHWRNVAGRFHRARTRLAEMRGRIDESSIASILGDSGGSPCRFEDSIAMLQTVASVVFDAERGIVWVATGRAPVSTNEYIAFDLNEERVRHDLGTLHPAAELDEAKRTAFDAYREGYEADFNDRDAVGARGCLERARAAQPEQPIYHFVAGLLSLRENDPHDAERCFDAAIDRGHPTEQRMAAFHLWRGRARDVRGARADACRDYRAALPGDPAVVRAAERGLRTAWRRSNVPIEWTFGDVVAP